MLMQRVIRHKFLCMLSLYSKYMIYDILKIFIAILCLGLRAKKGQNDNVNGELVGNKAKITR